MLLSSKSPMSSCEVIEKLTKPEEKPFLKSISLQPSDNKHRIEVVARSISGRLLRGLMIL